MLGPDFSGPNDAEQIKGQFLYSASQNPDKPELFPGWNGEHISGHAAYASWDH
jgi:hypothetical protein